MSASEIEAHPRSPAHEIGGKEQRNYDLLLVGFKRRAVASGQPLASLIQKIEKKPISTGILEHHPVSRRSLTVGVSPVIQKSSPLE